MYPIMHHFAIAVVNENPTMHYFGISRHIKSMIAYNILMEYFWKFQWKLHCGNVVFTPSYQAYSVNASI